MAEMLKEDIMPIIYSLFQTVETECLLTHFMNQLYPTTKMRQKLYEKTKNQYIL